MAAWSVGRLGEARQPPVPSFPDGAAGNTVVIQEWLRLETGKLLNRECLG